LELICERKSGYNSTFLAKRTVISGGKWRDEEETEVLCAVIERKAGAQKAQGDVSGIVGSSMSVSAKMLSSGNRVRPNLKRWSEGRDRYPHSR
jgi:hypothetical protein